MPFDYPGEYAGRFDGFESGEVCAYFASWNYSPGPGVASLLKVRTGRGTPVASRVESWLAGRQIANLVIEQLKSRSLQAGRWRVRNARVLRFSGRTDSQSGVAIEKIEIAHEGILRIP